MRREDPRLLRGRGRYFDDLKLADQLYAAIVRSPHAHADIRGIDTRAAAQMPGVHAVLTGEDYRADALGSLPSMAPYKKRDGSPMYLPPRPAIAIGRVMHVGYPVAVVVADTLDLARDAAEQVAVDYAPRPAVVSAREAAEKNAPQLYDDCPGNEAYFYQAGDKAKTDAGFCRRRACGRAAPRHQSRHRQSDRAAWRHSVSTTPVPAATRCIAASSGRGCSATTSPAPR